MYRKAIQVTSHCFLYFPIQLIRQIVIHLGPTTILPGMICERKVMLLRQTVQAIAQDDVLGYNFSYINSSLPPLDAML